MMAVAHAEAWRNWRAALNGERMHHAWMLAGPRGIGKTEFALAAAAELVGVVAPQTPDLHPDILLLRREPKDATEEKKAEEGKPFEARRNIAIAQIRAMQQRLTTRPTLGTRRAIIIDPADDLEPNAANALLKSLEEPPVGTFFLLIAHHPARLLPTIRSRCRVLRFNRNVDAGVSADEDNAQLAATVDAMLHAQGELYGLLQKFAAVLGSRPTRPTLQGTINLAQRRLASTLPDAGPEQFARIDTAFAELSRLESELASYNYDPDLLAMRIGALLSGITAPIATHNG